MMKNKVLMNPALLRQRMFELVVESKIKNFVGGFVMSVRGELTDHAADLRSKATIIECPRRLVHCLAWGSTVHDRPRRDGTEKQEVGFRSSHKSSCVFYSKLERCGDNQYADMVSNGGKD